MLCLLLYFIFCGYYFGLVWFLMSGFDWVYGSFDGLRLALLGVGDFLFGLIV